jgi:hypothetical protein
MAEDIAVFDDDVALVDAEAELDAVGGRDARVPIRHAGLDLARAVQRVDGAGKLGQEIVAGGLDDAAVMGGDRRVDQLGTDRRKAFERTFLVGLDQSRVPATSAARMTARRRMALILPASARSDRRE